MTIKNENGVIEATFEYIYSVCKGQFIMKMTLLKQPLNALFCFMMPILTYTFDICILEFNINYIWHYAILIQFKVIDLNLFNIEGYATPPLLNIKLACFLFDEKS